MITPQECPVGKRFLLKPRWETSLWCGEIQEWAPSGIYVKIDGAWHRQTDFVMVEELPPIPPHHVDLVRQILNSPKDIQAIQKEAYALAFRAQRLADAFLPARTQTDPIAQTVPPT